MNTKDVSKKTFEVGDTNKINEEGAPVPTRNCCGLVPFVFMLFTMTCFV
jgi:hypothetical protein